MLYGRGFVRFAELSDGHLHAGEAERNNCTAHKIGRLCGPSLAPKAWRILGEAGCQSTQSALESQKPGS